MAEFDYLAARKRRMEANYARSLEDGGLYSPQTQRGLREFHDKFIGTDEAADAAIRREISKIDAQGKWDAKKAEWNARGMIGQGSEAAKYNAEGVKEHARQLTEQEKAKADAAIHGSRNQWGYMGDDGNWVSGGHERAMREQAEAARENARLERDARIEAARLAGESRRDTAEINANGRVTSSRINAEATRGSNMNAQQRSDQNAFERWQAQALDFRNQILSPDERTAFSKMTPEQQRQFWLSKTGRQQQQQQTNGRARYSGSGSFAW